MNKKSLPDILLIKRFRRKHFFRAMKITTLLLFMFIMGIHIAEPILQLLKSAVGIVLGSEQVSFGEMLVLPWQSLAQ